MILKAKTYDEFKKEFPKHFGNMIFYASNKAQKEAELVKNIIKNSNSFEEFQEKITPDSLANYNQTIIKKGEINHDYNYRKNY